MLQNLVLTKVINLIISWWKIESGSGAGDSGAPQIISRDAIFAEPLDPDQPGLLTSVSSMRLGTVWGPSKQLPGDMRVRQQESRRVFFALRKYSMYNTPDRDDGIEGVRPEEV